MGAPLYQPMFDDDGNEVEGTLVRPVKVKETDPDYLQAEIDAKAQLRARRIALLDQHRSKGGRPPGKPNKVTIATKEFLKNVLDDPRYRATFRKRMFSGEIAPAVEQMAYHYVIGKPKEYIDITANIGITTINLERLTDAQLQSVRELLQGVPQHALAAAIDAQPLEHSGPPDGDPPE